MNISRNRIILCAVIGVWFGLFTVLTTAGTKMGVAEIPSLSIPQELVADVVTRDRDLLKVTSTWPTSLTVENISDKEVSGFTIEIFAAKDDGGPGRYIRWGNRPDFGVQTPLFKPGETRTLSINAEVVKTFQDNNKPFLYIQLADVWVNNDPTYMYRYGALLKQDPNNPKVYTVIVDAKGRSKNQHQHHATFPHITHSVPPPFLLGCCTRELYQVVTVECDHTDPCDPNPGSRKCQVANIAYTVCGACCTDNQATSFVPCSSQNPFCQYTCAESKFVTHSIPCTCCNC